MQGAPFQRYASLNTVSEIVLQCLTLWTSENVKKNRKEKVHEPPELGYHDLPKRTGNDWNRPKRTYENTETDFYGYRNGPEQTSVGTETDQNRLEWALKRTGTYFSSYQNTLQWEPEKVGWGTIGTILIK